MPRLCRVFAVAVLGLAPAMVTGAFPQTDHHRWELPKGFPAPRVPPDNPDQSDDR